MRRNLSRLAEGHAQAQIAIAEGCTLSEDRGLLLAILAEMRALRADLHRAGVIPPQAANDDHLLMAISEAVGDKLFTASELIEHADKADDHLRAALAASLGEKPAPRSLGKLLARLEAKPSGGLVICRVGDERAGIIWTVRPAG